jgi:type I restriction enzyme M protein
MESRKLRVFTDADIDKVAATYHAWRNIGGTYENTDGYSYNATLAEVQKQDYKLTPGIYVGTEEVEDDGILFEDKMANLQATLQEQFAKGNELQKIIVENFEKL